MISELLRKWFGLTPLSCTSCELLRDQLDKSETERRELLARLLEKDKPEPSPQTTEEFKPIQPQYMPWRVRQQMMEAEDRRTAQLQREKQMEIDSLEKELGIAHAVERGESGGITAQVK